MTRLESNSSCEALRSLLEMLMLQGGRHGLRGSEGILARLRGLLRLPVELLHED